jgi:hypothetical protein
MGVIASPSASGRVGTAAWMVVGLLWVVALLNYLDRQLVTTMGKAAIGAAYWPLRNWLPEFFRTSSTG